MYIDKLMYKNVGPINDVNIDLEFLDGDLPKPILFVGENGSGKSTILSNIVDSFYEMAEKAFMNATESNKKSGHQYYKILSMIEINAGQSYMFSYVGYRDVKKYAYVSKCGNLSAELMKTQIGSAEAQRFNFKDEDTFKDTTIEKKDAERIWSEDVICYFGPDRYEKPIWMGDKYYNAEDYLHLQIKEKWKGYLYNPITVKNITSINLQWLIDVIIDSRPDVVGDEDGLAISNVSTKNLFELRKAKDNLEIIMSKILGEEICFDFKFRNSGNSRLRILRKKDRTVIVSSLDSLSTGQLALFNMFSTIVRYADYNQITLSFNLDDITGIVVIDEIELHLHTKLQREVLPQLIKLFPKVQFIITTHAPLFLLGMQETFGDNKFDIFELPDATKIDVERFSEFQKAYDYFKKTRVYQREVENFLLKYQPTTRTVIITEGATDWKHLKAAYNTLSRDEKYKYLFDELSFEFFEYEPSNSMKEAKYKLDMGNTTLIPLCENLAKIPQDTRYVFIADRDHEGTNKKLGGISSEYKKWGNNVYSFILPVPDIRKSTPNICIEHLYSDEEIKKEIEIDGITRRLFIGNEFDVRGMACSIQRVCEKKSICGPESIAIIEGTQGDKVTSFENIDNINYALPKMKFANYILEKIPPFDNINFENFIAVFEIIKKIVDEPWVN